MNVLGVDRKAGSGANGDEFVADLGTPEGNRSAVEEATRRFGGLDVVIANAGFQHVSPLEKFPVEAWDELLAVLLTSPFLLAKYAWPALKASPSARFILIASAHALVASPGKAGYVAAKHGAAGLVKTLALEGADHGIAATALCPGFVRTPLVDSQVRTQAELRGIPADRVLEEVILAPHAIKRLIEPDEVAEMVSFLIGATGETFSGACLAMDLGWTAC